MYPRWWCVRDGGASERVIDNVAPLYGIKSLFIVVVVELNERSNVRIALAKSTV